MEPHIINLFLLDCPAGNLTSAGDRCESVTALIRLLFQPGETDNPGGARSIFEAALSGAIEAGDLQSALDIVNPDSVAFILTGANGGPIVGGTGAGGGDDGLSDGGITGIVIGAASAFLLVAIAMAMYARREREDKADRNALAPAPGVLSLDGDEEDAINPASRDKKGSAAVLGATTPDYGKKHKPTVDQSIMDKDIDMEGMSDHVHGDDSSNAGSSGWSSSAGVSSLNTGSNDGIDAIEEGVVGVAAGTSLAAIAGAAGATAATSVRRKSESDTSDTPSSSSPSRSDLDDAIEANDWAAVGKLLFSFTQTCPVKRTRQLTFSSFFNTKVPPLLCSLLHPIRNPCLADLDTFLDL